MNPLKPPVAVGRDVEKLENDAGSRGKAERGDDENQDAFENGEDELEVAGLLDAEIVESGHEPGDGDGEDLRPEKWQCPERDAVRKWNAGKTPRVRASPLVTAAIDAGLATANHVHI